MRDIVELTQAKVLPSNAMLPCKPHRRLTPGRLTVVNHYRAESQRLTEHFHACCLAVPCLDQPGGPLNAADTEHQQARAEKQGLVQMQALQARAASQPLQLQQGEPLSKALLSLCPKEVLQQLKCSMTPSMLPQTVQAAPAEGGDDKEGHCCAFTAPCTLEVPLMPESGNQMPPQVHTQLLCTHNKCPMSKLCQSYGSPSYMQGLLCLTEGFPPPAKHLGDRTADGLKQVSLPIGQHAQLSE